VERTIIDALDEHGRHDHRPEAPVDWVELNVRALTKTAKGFDGMRPI
jgi:hypothetical protein